MDEWLKVGLIALAIIAIILILVFVVQGLTIAGVGNTASAATSAVKSSVPTMVGGC